MVVDDHGVVAGVAVADVGEVGFEFGGMYFDFVHCVILHEKSINELII